MIQKIYSKDLETPQTKEWKEKVEEYSYDKNLGLTFSDCFYLSKSKDEDISNPDKTGLILSRIFLTDLDFSLSKDTKYVLLQSYYNKGDLATIDIVRLPKNYHNDIIQEYVPNMLPADTYKKFDVKDILKCNEKLIIGYSDVLKDGYSRFLTGGGHIRKEDNSFTFDSTSSSFGNELMNYDVNDITGFLLDQSSFSGKITNKIENGQKYIDSILNNMITYKKTEHFYNSLQSMYLPNKVLSKNNNYLYKAFSLLLMEASDNIYDHDEFISNLVKSMYDRKSKRSTFLHGLTDNLRR